MTKDVLVSISGVQFERGHGGEPVELITSADYYKKNEKHYILYDEVQEGFTEPTKNIVKIGEDFFGYYEAGNLNVHMVFEKNKKNVTYYYTPYGSILIGIDTTRIEVNETENDIFLEVDYELEANYEYVADCQIKMNIKSKTAGDFKI